MKKEADYDIIYSNKVNLRQVERSAFTPSLLKSQKAVKEFIVLARIVLCMEREMSLIVSPDLTQRLDVRDVVDEAGIS